MQILRQGLTPMSTSTKLNNDENGKSIDNKLYWDMMWFLVYLIKSELEIMFIVCIFSCFQANSKESHLHVVKRIFKYLKNTLSLKLWYSLKSY